MNIHSASDQKFDRDKNRMGEQNYFKSRYYFFFRKVKLKNWFNNIFAFKKNFFKFDNVKEFHHELTNIVYLGREKDVSWYCYCDYRYCCFIKKHAICVLFVLNYLNLN